MQTDPEAFANSVIDLLSSEEERRRVGTAGMRVISTRFDWDAITRLLEDYFVEIAGKQPLLSK